MALSKSMSIGRFIFLMGILFLILVSICFSLLLVSLSGQFRSSGRLMDYTGAWNDIFVAMMEIGTSLDLMVVGDADGDDLASYEAASDSLSAAVERFLAAYATDDESANVMRRLQSFNEYQRSLIEGSDAPISFYLDRRYVDVGIERHTEEVLALYRSQMDTVLAQYADDMEHITRRILLSFLAVVAITAVISAVYLWFGMTIRNTIGRAVANLDAISQGTWDVPNLQGGRFEEFRRLFVGINRLKHRLAAYFRQLQDWAELERSLLDEKLKNETANRMLISAEMDMLRSQVNPHFLFNSLSQIGLAVLVDDTDQVLDMVECTGRILRYSLYNKERLVPLADEISIVRTYMRLHQMSNADDISFSICYDDGASAEETDGCLIVPMCIQPVVENSIKHGYDRSRGHLSIKVVIGRKDSMVVVDILDDGAGMADPEGVLRSASKGIGLNNIRRRLELQYGRDDLLEVDSVPGGYTLVELRFPQEVE